MGTCCSKRELSNEEVAQRLLYPIPLWRQRFLNETQATSVTVSLQTNQPAHDPLQHHSQARGLQSRHSSQRHQIREMKQAEEGARQIRISNYFLGIGWALSIAHLGRNRELFLRIALFYRDLIQRGAVPDECAQRHGMQALAVPHGTAFEGNCELAAAFLQAGRTWRVQRYVEEGLSLTRLVARYAINLDTSAPRMMEWIQPRPGHSGGLVAENLEEGSAADSLLATKDCLLSHFELFAQEDQENTAIWQAVFNRCISVLYSCLPNLERERCFLPPYFQMQISDQASHLLPIFSNHPFSRQFYEWGPRFVWRLAIFQQTSSNERMRRILQALLKCMDVYWPRRHGDLVEGFDNLKLGFDIASLAGYKAVGRIEGFKQLLLDLQADGLRLGTKSRNDDISDAHFDSHTMFVLLQMLMAPSFPLEWPGWSVLPCQSFVSSCAGRCSGGDNSDDLRNLEEDAFRTNRTAGVALERSTITQLEQASASSHSAATSRVDSLAASAAAPRRVNYIEDSAAEEDDIVPGRGPRSRIAAARLAWAAGRCREEQDRDDGTPPYGKGIAVADTSASETASVDTAAVEVSGTEANGRRSWSTGEDTDPDRPESSAKAARRAERRAAKSAGLSRARDVRALSQAEKAERASMTIKLSDQSQRRESKRSTRAAPRLDCGAVAAKLEDLMYAYVPTTRQQSSVDSASLVSSRFSLAASNASCSNSPRAEVTTLPGSCGTINSPYAPLSDQLTRPLMESSGELESTVQISPGFYSLPNLSRESSQTNAASQTPNERIPDAAEADSAGQSQDTTNEPVETNHKMQSLEEETPGER